MNVLFVMDPLDKINVSGYSTYMLMLEACRRGWNVAYCTPDQLYVLQGEAFGAVSFCVVSPKEPFFQVDPVKELSLGTFDIVWMRKDPPFNMDYIFSTYMLDLVPKKTMVLNDPLSIRNANEKMFALQFPQFCPPTMVTREIERARRFAKEQETKVVIKPWDGNGGRGVLVSHYDDPNFRSMLEILTEEEKNYILVQRYIPEVVQGDKRIILVDGEAVGWMLRVPQPGDHRGNMHVGAKVAPFELSDRDKEICAVLRPVLKKLGLLFVGIDIIGQYLTEINVTSPTGIREINPMMNVEIEKMITDAVLLRYSTRRE
ncbi:MAG: glutathione synthase [Myxococcota bacterium]|nr:glutathione synthase [Myxococcota bacterium]